VYDNRLERVDAQFLHVFRVAREVELTITNVTEPTKLKQTRSPAVAKIADRTVCQ